jgi:hypothetical protein
VLMSIHIDKYVVFTLLTTRSNAAQISFPTRHVVP